MRQPPPPRKTRNKEEKRFTLEKVRKQLGKGSREGDELFSFRAFSYTDYYCRDIRFDNIYISTYFHQIDDRRKKLGRRSLLPLRKAEKATVIFPFKPTIQATEMKNVVRRVLPGLGISRPRHRRGNLVFNW